MSNVRRRRSRGTHPQSSSECKYIWRSKQQLGVAAFTANTCSIRLAALLRAATEWRATAIAHSRPTRACRKYGPSGLPVPPAGGQRTNGCARKAPEVEQFASWKRSTQAHSTHEHKPIGSLLAAGLCKPENTSVCVLAGTRSQARPKYTTAADA